MPYIEVKALERRIDDESAKRVIQAMTDALCEALGEEIRAQTWVVIDSVPSGRWGIAGEPLA